VFVEEYTKELIPLLEVFGKDRINNYKYQQETNKNL
jgi:hypothetical protein